MNLNIAERLVLAGLLPDQGDIVTLRLVTDLRSRLLFTEEEMKEAGIVQDGTAMRWEPGCDLMKDVKIGSATRGIIVSALKKLNDDKQLTANHIPLYERFVETAAEEP